MIIIEKFTHNGKEYKRAHSSNSKMRLHKIGTNEYYTTAVDVIDSTNEYEEVAKPERLDVKPPISNK